MNKIYRLIWSRSREMWMAVSEKVAAGWFRRPLVVGALSIAAILATGGTAKAVDPNTLPTGGQVVAGQASIAQSGNAMTINQSTDKMIANWNTFNIGQNASVAFQQPGVSSVALNRILDQNPSQIFGRLSANGQIFLLNPAGVYFGSTAQVDVGGLVASSLNLTNENFLSGKYLFENEGMAGSIINQGQIRTASGGYVAFLSPKITNEGTISTPGGTTALAAGDKVSLDFTGDRLVTFTVDQGAVDALIENKGLIQAEGGAVMLTAKAANNLTNAVVNNEGIIEAQTLENKAGRILLISDMEHGETVISGRLDASAPNGGDGGLVETSAANVTVRDDARVFTSTQNGKEGLWLIDPNNFTIAAADGNITGKTLATNLQGGSITIDTTTQGTAGGSGDIFINDNINTSGDLGAARTLSLKAERNIVQQAGKSINATQGGNTRALNLVYCADSDAINGGGILLDNNSSISTNGGHLWMGGGSGSVAWNGLTVGDGFAVGNDFGLGDPSLNSSGIVFGTTAPSGISVNTSGGDIAMFGKTASAINANHWGIAVYGGTSINSGAGKIAITGVNQGGGNSWTSGIEFFTSSTLITSASSASDAIVISGDASAATSTAGNAGIIIKADTTLSATAGGGINLTGTSNTGGPAVFKYDIYLEGASVLANSGPVTITGTTAQGIVGTGNVSIGYKAGSAVTASTSDITLLADKLTLAGTDRLQTSGALTIKPYTANTTIGIAGGAGTLQLPASYFSSNFTDGFSGITVGNATAGAITTGGNLAINDDLTLRGGEDIAVGAGLIWDGTTKLTLETPGTVNVNAAIENTNTATGGVYFSAGNATNMVAFDANGKVIIHNVQQLQWMNTALAGKYELGENIDASATSGWNGGLGFAPVGTFTGSFNGLNHTISGLTINRPTTDYVGLFGYTSGSSVSNVGLAGGAITGKTYVGGLVGYNSSSDINNSYATGAVTGGSYVGGLVGYHYLGNITNTYSTGAVTGTTTVVGGLLGYLDAGTITNAYSSGLVTGTPGNTGGLVSYNETGSVNNSFWDTATSHQSTSGGGTGKTTAEMKTLATFTGASWDIDGTGGTGKVWRIYEGNTYPLLRSFMTNATITSVADDSKTYDGIAYSGGNGYVVNGASADHILYGGAAQGAKNAGDYTLTIFSDQQGYDLLGTRTANLTINKRLITSVSGTRIYDRSANANGTDLTTLTGEIVGDDLSLSGAGTVADKNVGNNKALTSMGDLALAGTDKGNYDLTGATRTLTITAKNFTADYTGTNKNYDATTAATVTGSSGDIIAGDTVAFSQTSIFTDKNVGIGWTVNVMDIAIDGTDAANYTLQNTTAATTADITPAPLTVTADDATKTYGDVKTFVGTEFTSVGLVGGETIGSATLASVGAVATAGVPGSPYAITASDATGGTFNTTNYTIAYKDGILKITVPVNDSVDSAMTSGQNGVNGTQQDQGGNPGGPHAPSMGAGVGSGGVVPPPMMTSSLAGGSVTLTTPTFSTPVTITEAGQTTTLTMTGGGTSGPMVEVGALPVFTQTGNAQPALQGNFVMHESGSALSLTPTAPTGTGMAAPLTTGAPSGNSAPFTLTLENGMTLQLTATVTSDGVLVVSAPDAAGNIDIQQAILMGAQVAKQALQVELTTLNSALFVRN